MSKPIRPDDVIKHKKLPNEVIDSFNEIIANRFNNGRSNFKQKEVVALIVAKGIGEAKIYQEHYLDVEDLYRAQGWKVEYDKPGYNESYDANFTFSKK